MKQRKKPFIYTVKIYGEGLTEWVYFDSLRTSSRFRFSLEPEIPDPSRSSYKANLKLIDKELRKSPEARADAIFLVLDTDTLVKDEKQYADYQDVKRKYEKRGVTFIESHPCIELWFLYHMINKFQRTTYPTYQSLYQQIKTVLPGYEKTERYFKRNKTFQDCILNNPNRLANAIGFGVLSCKRDRAESANYTEVFRVVRFCRLLSKYTEIKSLLEERLRREVEIIPKYTKDGTTLQILYEGMECCKLTYEGNSLRGFVGDGQVYEVDDALPLSLQTPFQEDLVAWFSDRD